MKFILLDNYLKRYVRLNQNGKNRDEMTNEDWIQVNHIKNIIFTPENKRKLFKYAIKIGKLDSAKYIYSLGGINSNDWIFQSACYHNHESIARWLYSLGGIDIHSGNDYAFRDACYHNHESIARWLYSLGGVDIHASDDWAFLLSCYNDHESIARWLYSLGGIDIHANRNASFR